MQSAPARWSARCADLPRGSGRALLLACSFLRKARRALYLWKVGRDGGSVYVPQRTDWRVAHAQCCPIPPKADAVAAFGSTRQIRLRHLWDLLADPKQRHTISSRTGLPECPGRRRIPFLRGAEVTRQPPRPKEPCDERASRQHIFVVRSQGREQAPALHTPWSHTSSLSSASPCTGKS